MSQYFTGSQTKNASMLASTCFTVMVQCIVHGPVLYESHVTWQRLLTYLVFWHLCVATYPSQRAARYDLRQGMTWGKVWLESWYKVTTDAIGKLCRATKTVLLLGVSTCHTTSFECLRHIHLSLQQSMTYLSMTSKSCFYHISSIAGTDKFQYIHSEGLLQYDKIRTHRLTAQMRTIHSSGNESGNISRMPLSYLAMRLHIHHKICRKNCHST